MLALVLLAERSLAHRKVDLLDGDFWAYTEAARAARAEAVGARLLCFGDSMVKCLVVPGALAERSGRRAVNLALSGGQATTSYYLLKRALDAGARPEAVVVDFFPTLQREGPRVQAKRWPGVIGAAEALDLAVVARDPDLFGAVVLARWLPSLRARDGLRALARAAAAGNPADHRWVTYVMRRNLTRNRGAQLLPANPATARLTPDAVEAVRRGFFPAMTCAPVNDRALTRFLALAASRGVRVFWVLPPVAPALQAAVERSGFDAAHRRFVLARADRFPNVTVIDARRAVADASAYYDLNHLGAAAAYAYSLALGDLLRAELDRPPATAPGRWAVLPPLRPGPLPDGLEDFEMSAVALGKSDPTARR